ncbi:hypothetical protein ACFUJR_14695 [Streptomyces sp. NPDC057271]|uniref:hypothetical protein n=1 Tax=unclassified Streptomyces TaxID=2593676 RepID=UPI00363F9C78
MATDDYGQSITIPALTDAPSIAAMSAAVQQVLQRAVLSFASASARNATLVSPVEGMTAWLQDSNTMTQYDGASWQPLQSGGTWTAYAPAWTANGSNPSISNGSIAGRYQLIGKTCTAVFEVVCGTTTTFGTGSWAISLPFAVASPGSTSANWCYLGSARGHNPSQWVAGTVAALQGTSVARIYSHEHAAEWSNSQPHVWTATTANHFQGQVTYEVV